MAQLENITVNGKPVREFLSKEQSREIQNFLRDELRMMSRSTRSHISTAPSGRSHEYRRQAPKATVTYAA